MKASDYIASELAQQVKHVFGVTGAHALHLVDSIGRQQGLTYVPCAHEQGAAFAADAYARLKGFGVAISTSGPGALNLVSGVASAYFDSVPVMFVTGQVTTNTMRGMYGPRQLGFQETDMCGILKPITKYSTCITRAAHLRVEIGRCRYEAKGNRFGAVHIDLPDDIQRAELTGDEPMFRSNLANPFLPDIGLYRQIIPLIERSERPVLVLGAGIRQAQIDSDWAFSLATRLGIPTLLTWGGLDLLPADHPQNCGGFGVCGPYAGNWAIQHADLIICLGTRLDHHMTGTDPMTFAPDAIKVLVDIDQAELDKYPWRDALRIRADLWQEGLPPQLTPRPEWTPWLEGIREQMRLHPVGIQYLVGKNPYDFIRGLSDTAGTNDIIVTDAGATLCWVMQTWRVKRGQRILSSFNHSPMGWAIPGAIGAAFAEPGRRIICVTGDGSFQMNVQELATIARHNLDIKICVLNNQGYGIIRQTQDTWLEGRHAGAADELGRPHVAAIALAYGVADKVTNVAIDPAARIVPKTGKGKSISDLEPEAVR